MGALALGISLVPFVALFIPYGIILVQFVALVVRFELILVQLVTLGLDEAVGFEATNMAFGCIFAEITAFCEDYKGRGKCRSGRDEILGWVKVVDDLTRRSAGGGQEGN